ncbi:hypothetical protein NM208_g8004 [Fusarium decemcellulare]|uniref:Uncharacterized protein n=1 Tax=Fusarium decemcellulare TaxID=57161 RepID=A0ACC1S710_9HYPO|nr:hypothetical protein NM208_g8004 [Fusarium decemcellulare]
MHLLRLLVSATAVTVVGANQGQGRQGRHKRQLISGVLGIDATFDYVIVGGGTAGLVLANRLSSNPDHAGWASTIFAGSSPSDTNPLVDWNFVTEPQAGADDRRIHYARGKCLGGSSARNFMIYQRSTKQSYQKWATQVGDDGYTWDSLLPYFEKSVEFTPPSSSRFPNASAEFNEAAFSSSGGPLSVSYANYAQPFSTYLEPSLHELGIGPVQDFNSGKLMGAQFCSSTIDPETQKRESSQTSFLEQASGRQNLKVYQLALAKKIIFDKNKRATGVKVQGVTGITQFTLNARNEVIVSAGAFQSPQLLMVSGVGPRNELEKFDIPIIAERPGVGQGMQDHVFFGPTWRVNVQTLTRLANDPVYLAAHG